MVVVVLVIVLDNQAELATTTSRQFDYQITKLKGNIRR